MKKLLSLPPNLVECFHDITGADRKEWFCTSDPVGKKLGSGGGTAWLLDLQLPLYEEIMDKAPEGMNTLIASGDVYIRAKEQLQEIPEADVVCYGLWEDPQLMKNHGVFVSSRRSTRYQ